MEETINKEREVNNGFKNSKIYLFLKKIYNHKNVKYVLFLYLVSLFCFGITLINNYFTLPVNGDFVLQEIPFYYNGYDDWWTFIKTGKFVFWDENTNLGMNNIGANSFYYLLNIFFLPTLLVPRSLIPQMQAFLIMSKMVLASYIMKRLLNERFNVSNSTSEMIGVCYGFCGWTLYYLWFNHFIEITILFPLVIYGIELVLKEEKPIGLILSLFLSAITNYFFFIMICFCTVFYAIFRYFQLFPKYSSSQKRNVILIGIGSYIVGLTLSLAILFPAFSVALNSSRASSSSYSTTLVNSINAIINSIKSHDFKYFLHNVNAFFKNLCYFTNGGSTSNIYNVERVYLYPLVTFFYPTVSCNSHLLFNNNGYDNALSSLFLYTPTMLMVIPSLILSFKEKKVSHIVGFILLLVLTFSPFAYYCFSGFTNICYGRWELFIVVCAFIYVGINYDRRSEMKKYYLDISLAICLMMEIVLYFTCKKLQNTSGVNKMDEDAINVCIAQMIYLVILYVYIRVNFKSKNLMNTLKWVGALEAAVSFNLLLGFNINLGDKNVYVGFFGTSSYSSLYGGRNSVKEETSIISSLKKEDDSFYRIYNTSFIRSSNNLGMVESYNGLGTFHSIYNYELDDFIKWTHFSYNGSWSMGEHEKKINLDNFLNVKYYITSKDDNNIPFGYSLKEETASKKVYINDNYIPLGYNFTNMVSARTVNEYYKNSSSIYQYRGSSYQGIVPKTEYLLTSSAILYEEDAYEIMGKYPSITFDTGMSFNTSFYDKVGTFNISDRSITIRSAKWNDGPGGDGSFTNEWDEYDSYSVEKATGLKWNSELIADLSSFPIAYGCEDRGGAYVTINCRMGENVIVTLYDKDDVEIVSDSHMKNTYDKSSDTKFERGFYVDRPIYKIKLTVRDTFKSNAVLVKPNATYEYYDIYKQNMDLQKKNQFTNVKVDVNKYTFDSSLSYDTVSVLTIPFDKGFSLTRIDGNGNKEKVKLYKAQGGFISFVNPKGTNHYILEYHTPYLATGMIGFSFGAMMLIGVIYLEILKEDKKFIQNMNEFTKN